jgi:hypothetical protein
LSVDGGVLVLRVLLVLVLRVLFVLVLVLVYLA